MNARPAISALLAASILMLAPGLARPASLEKGLKAGLNFANLRGAFAPVAGFKARLGFVGGGYLALPVNSALAFQTEVLLSKKGAKTGSLSTDPNGNPTGAYNLVVDLTYLEIPVLARISLPATGGIVPSAFAGPSFGIKLGGKVRTDLPGQLDADLGELKAVDVGVAAGAGVRVGRGPVKFLVDARYTTGLSDIYDVNGNLESINSVFSLTTGVSF